MKSASGKGVVFVGAGFWKIAKGIFREEGHSFKWKHPRYDSVEYLKYCDYFQHERNEGYSWACTATGYLADGRKGEEGVDYRISAPYVMVFLDQDKIPRDDIFKFMKDVLDPMREATHTCACEERFVVDPMGIVPADACRGATLLTTYDDYSRALDLNEIGGAWVEMSHKMFGLSSTPSNWGTPSGKRRVGLLFYGEVEAMQLFEMFAVAAEAHREVTRTVFSQTAFYLIGGEDTEYVAPLISHRGQMAYAWDNMEGKGEDTLACSEIFYIPMEPKEWGLLKYEGIEATDSDIKPRLVITIEDWIDKVRMVDDGVVRMMSKYYDNFNAGKDWDNLFDGMDEYKSKREASTGEVKEDRQGDDSKTPKRKREQEPKERSREAKIRCTVL